MRGTGMVRKIDDLGRVVVPIEIRRTLNWEVYAPIEILSDGEGVYLRAYAPGCILCGEAERLIDVQGKRFCKKCAREIGEAGK